MEPYWAKKIHVKGSFKNKMKKDQLIRGGSKNIIKTIFKSTNASPSITFPLNPTILFDNL